jgi:ligand-binding sensor domain-containing protein
MKILRLLLTGFVVIFFTACEKDSGLKPVNENWEYLASKNGLVNNNILCIEQGSSGIYIGTEFGFSSYDGSSFRNYNTPQGLIHHQVNGLAVANDGTVWLATPYGLSVMSGNQFVNYNAESGLS